jgi:hypothetical protein
MRRVMSWHHHKLARDWTRYALEIIKTDDGREYS